MADLVLGLDELKNNLNAQVVITVGGQRPVVGFNRRDLVLSGGNEFNSLFESGKTQAASQTLQRGVQVIDELARMAKVQSNLGSYNLKSLEQTQLSWSGSRSVIFTVDLLFVALRPGDDVRIPVAKLLEAVYPTTENRVTLRAPLGYNPSSRSGLSILKIGNWFRATKLVIEDVNFSLSQRVTSDGLPLYAEGSVVLRPFRAVTFDDMLSYIGLSRADLNKTKE